VFEGNDKISRTVLRAGGSFDSIINKFGRPSKVIQSYIRHINKANLLQKCTLIKRRPNN
jgi:hypothetical protein